MLLQPGSKQRIPAVLLVKPPRLWNGDLQMRGTLADLRVKGIALGEHVASAYTPHSWRAFLLSATGVLAFPESDTRWLSAWNATGGDAYVRTSRQSTAKIQSSVASAVRTSLGGPHGIREGLCRVELATHLSSRGVSEETTKETVPQKTWSPLRKHSGTNSS